MQPARIAINGFGRIGRLFFRQVFGKDGFDIVAVNDLGDVQNLAYLLKHDSVYRTYSRDVQAGVGVLSVDGKGVTVLQERDPARLPWKDMNVDIVVEATGFFESFEKAAAHLAAGAKRVILTAPAKDADGPVGSPTGDHGVNIPVGATVLMGVNDGKCATATLTSNASCTTNAASPVIAIMAENPGIQKAILSTVHAYTATQSIVDGPLREASKDFRRGRAGAQNIVPSTTGAAIAVTRAVPELEGKFDGLAFRVPVPAGSLADITFLAKRKTSVEEINDIFRKAAVDPRWQGIMTVTEEQVVSSDIIGEPYGAIIDLSFTKVVDGDLVKVLSWYDNEWGYAATLVRHVQKVAEFL